MCNHDSFFRASAFSHFQKKLRKSFLWILSPDRLSQESTAAEHSVYNTIVTRGMASRREGTRYRYSIGEDDIDDILATRRVHTLADTSPLGQLYKKRKTPD